MAEATAAAIETPPKVDGARKKRRSSFLSAFTILFAVTVTLIAAVCTWFVPAGQYSSPMYNAESGTLEMTSPEGDVQELDATQETLDNLGVSIDINQFTSGAITKAVSIVAPESLDQKPYSLADVTRWSTVWSIQSTSWSSSCAWAV